jgi:hypothetical protein
VLPFVLSEPTSILNVLPFTGVPRLTTSGPPDAADLVRSRAGSILIFVPPDAEASRVPLGPSPVMLLEPLRGAAYETFPVSLPLLPPESPINTATGARFPAAICLSWSCVNVTVPKLLETVTVPSELAVALPKYPPGRLTCDVTGMFEPWT